MSGGVADDRYDEGYWERGEGSNYIRYTDDPGWASTWDVLAGEVPAGCGVLDVGAAKGWFVRHGLDRGFDCWGVDVSRWAVEHPAPRVRERLLLAGADDVPFGDACFDVVCSWEVLEHLQEPTLTAALDEMERVLAPGGLLAHRICLPGSDDHDATHVTVRPRDWWAEVFARRGWRQIPLVEDALDEAHAGRDWAGRFFVLVVDG